MGSWETRKLGELIGLGMADPQTGPFGTMLSASEYCSDGIPVIAVQDIGENKLQHHKLVYVNPEVSERLRRYRVLENDIVFGRKGAIDRRALIKASEAGWIQGSDCIRLRFNGKVDPKFVSYQLGSSFHSEWLHQHATGATMPSLNQEVLRLLPLQLPPLKVQQEIAEVLTSLDDKINLLHQQNLTLEQMAETLFHKWFIVDGDENWETIRLGDLVSVGRGLSYKGSGLVEEGSTGAIPMVNLNSIFENGGFKESGLKFYNGAYKTTHVLTSGDVVILNTDLTQDNRIIGWPAIVPDHIEKSLFSHHIYKLTINSSSITNHFLYYLLKHTTIHDQLVGATNGTTVSMLPIDGVLLVEFRLPPLTLVRRFDEITLPNYKKKTNNQNQVKILEKLRNTLLPKLMSGEVRILSNQEKLQLT